MSRIEEVDSEWHGRLIAAEEDLEDRGRRLNNDLRDKPAAGKAIYEGS